MNFSASCDVISSGLASLAFGRTFMCCWRGSERRVIVILFTTVGMFCYWHPSVFLAALLTAPFYVIDPCFRLIASSSLSQRVKADL